jgi:hypothetical protein
MKHLFFIGIFLAITTICHAQASNDYDLARSSKKQKIEINSNPFADAEMEVTKELVSFTNLPDVPKPTWAIVTNSEGEFIKQAKVNPTYNAMDIHRLPKGMYFVTLMYRNRGQKAFVLKVDEPGSTD